jgi:hypothetical protein
MFFDIGRLAHTLNVYAHPLTTKDLGRVKRIDPKTHMAIVGVNCHEVTVVDDEVC